MSAWYESLVQVRRSDFERGSGVFISSTEVLTAAHVVCHGGTVAPLGELTLDVRYRQQLVEPLSIAVLPAWAQARSSAADLALIRVAAQNELGIAPVFGVPPVSGSAMLEGFGFLAATDKREKCSGLVECEPTSDGELLLFTNDFLPEKGMSGGPFCVGQDGAARVAGVITRASRMVGVALVEAVLQDLRALL